MQPHWRLLCARARGDIHVRARGGSGVLACGAAEKVQWTQQFSLEEEFFKEFFFKKLLLRHDVDQLQTGLDGLQGAAMLESLLRLHAVG